jgi:hypothetical protein
LFGKGNWFIEIKYRDTVEANYDGFVLHETYSVMGSNVTVREANIQTNTQAVHNMHRSGASVEFSKVSGGTKGGKALLEVNYGSQGNAALLVSVNANNAPAENSHFLHCPSSGGWESFGGKAYVIIDLMPGEVNTVRLSGGAVNLRGIAVHLMP